MCYFIFTITEKAIDSELIQKLRNANLFVNECSCSIRDAKAGLYYYEINNGHCACDIAVSPYDKIEEVKELINSINYLGRYRFVIIDSECEDQYLEFEENKAIENTLNTLDTIEIQGDKLIKLYPKDIRFDVVYQVMNE